MVEARREGPKPLNIVFQFSKIKPIKQQRQQWRKFLEHRETRLLALHKESTIPRWSHFYNPIIYRINW
jgi:hypothetical protein